MLQWCHHSIKLTQGGQTLRRNSSTSIASQEFHCKHMHTDASEYLKLQRLAHEQLHGAR